MHRRFDAINIIYWYNNNTKKLQGAYEMKRISLIFMALIIILLATGCQNGVTSESKASESTTENKEDKASEKLYKLNEEAFITDGDGEKIYSLTINSAESMDFPAEYAQDMPKDTKKILAITYTFKYIKEDEKLDKLFVEPRSLQVYDENSLSVPYIDYYISDFYPLNSDLFMEEGINPGRSKETYAGYALLNETETIQIDFSSETFGRELTFEVPLEVK